MEQIVNSTSERTKMPNFFIVGAAKAGSSTLWRHLLCHPEVFMPEDELFKEPRYFSHPGKYKNLEHYLRLFSDATPAHRRIGEASTAYLTCPSAAERIATYGKEHNLGIKIIIMLRNPADRAVSLYNWMVQDGYEYSSNFESAIKRESQRAHKISRFWEPNYFHNYMYYRSGLYSDQVSRYLKLFGKENVHVVIFEDFIRKTANHLEDIHEFLNVSPAKEVYSDRVENPSYQVISPGIQFTLRKLTKLLSKLRLLRPESKESRDFLLKVGLTNKKAAKAKPEFRNQLLSRYRDDIYRLEKLINIDLSNWLNDAGTNSK